MILNSEDTFLSLGNQGGPVEIEGVDDFGMKIRQGHINKFGFKILILTKTIFVVDKRL